MTVRAIPLVPRPEGWISLHQNAGSTPPMYLQSNATYWFRYVAEQRAVYFQFNMVADDPEEPFESFSNKLVDFVEDHDVEKLIVDVRRNSGGNNFITNTLLHRIIGCSKINRPGGLFVMIGRQTFSACQIFVTRLDFHTHAVFVGEPTGPSPNFVGEDTAVRLPYSGVVAMISDLYWQNSSAMDYRIWIPPHIYAPPTFAAFRDGTDPALDAILAADHGAGPVEATKWPSSLGRSTFAPTR